MSRRDREAFRGSARDTGGDGVPETQAESAAGAVAEDGREPQGGPEASGSVPESLGRRGLRTLGLVLVVVVLMALVRTFLVQTYVIPSGSMEDTLQEGDRVAVTMYDSTEVHRGDVVVFRDPDGWLSVTEPTGARKAIQDVLIAVRILPEDAGHHLIKRVIGMPGDRVVSDGHGSLSVNGVPVTEPYLKPGRSASDIAFDVTVPEGCVWVMGDNRSNSADSRYHQSDAHGGAVPLADVVGVAKRVVWPVSRLSGLGSGESAFADVPAATGAAVAPTGGPAPTPAATLALGPVGSPAGPVVPPGALAADRAVVAGAGTPAEAVPAVAALPEGLNRLVLSA